MSVDYWFPLALYYEDLEGAPQHRDEFVRAIYEARRPHAENASAANAAWTGDVSGHDRVHDDPRFNWLTQEVGKHAWRYLDELGHDLDQVDLHVQRSWPVVTGPGQIVDAHSHHNAHLSAVYYVAAAADSGRLFFQNAGRPNELSPGSAGGTTGTYRSRNATNFGGSEYDPIEGRLLIFPSKQRHQVLRNESGEDRVSISFDLVITTRTERPGGSHEFLMPPPERWKRLPRPTASGMVEVSVDEPMDLHLLTRDHDRSTEYALVDTDGHPLWETRLYRHCASPADWSSHEQKAAAQPSPRPLPPDHPSWPVFRHAIDRVHHDLTRSGVATLGSMITPPHVVSDGCGIDSFGRSAADLAVYLRLDRNESTCAVEFSESGGVVIVEPGTMAVVGGCRRHRVIGDATVITFGVTVPTLARPGSPRYLDDHPDIDDETIFGLATALPMSAAGPAIDLIERKRDERSRRRRQRRSEQCPVVRAYLVDGHDPTEASDEERAVVRAYGTNTDEVVDGEANVVRHVPLFTPVQCADLIEFARRHMTSVVPDSVDDRPEYQVDLDVGTLRSVVGADAVDRLLAEPTPELSTTTRSSEAPSIFLRLFTADTRDFLTFHTDISGTTVNVPLEPDGSADGGELLMLYGGQLRVAPRRQGAALIHDSHVVHGVSRMKAGERWSLIAFFPPGGPATTPATQSTTHTTEEPRCHLTNSPRNRRRASTLASNSPGSTPAPSWTRSAPIPIRAR